MKFETLTFVLIDPNHQFNGTDHTSRFWQWAR